MLLAVGRLHEAKDYPNLFHAIEILLKQDDEHKNIYLFVVGDGDLRSELEHLITEKKLIILSSRSSWLYNLLIDLYF